MSRAIALLLLVVAAGLPLSVRPGVPPVGWLAAVALGLGVVGVVLWSLPCVTAAAAVAVIAYAVALAVAGPAADPLTALALGAALVLLLALVHWAGHARGATVGGSVPAALARQWLAVVGLGVAAAIALLAAARPLGGVLRSGPAPMVVVAGALGVLLVMAGVVVLVAREGGGSPAS